MTPYLADLGISFTMIGLIGGSYGFSQMVLRIPLGILSDRLGKRKLFIILGFIVCVISTAGMFVTQNPYIILTLRLFAGVAASAWVVMTILFTGYFEKGKQASRMSYLLAANFGGLMIARLIGGVIAERFGHEYTFLAGGAAGLLAIILSLFITEKATQPEELPSLRNLVGVIKDNNLIAMSILGIFTQMVLHSTTNTFTSEAGTQAGATLQQLGVIAAAASIPAILTSVVCGKIFIRRNLNVRYFLVAGFLLQAIGSIVITFGTLTIPTVYISTIIIAFGCGLCFSTLISFCTRNIDEGRRSAAMGFFQAIYALGMFAGPVIMGILVDHAGLSNGFLAPAAFAAMGLILTVVMIKNKQRD